MGNAKDIAELKQVTGYLMGFEFTRAKMKGKKVDRRSSLIWRLQNKKTGELVNIWGCGAINNMLIDGEIPESISLKNAGKIKIAEGYQGSLVRFTFKGLEKIKGRPQPMKKVDIEVDTDDVLNGKKR